jgi:hypothetical protein
MRQLGELKANAEKFADHGVEVIAIFREEKSGVDGLTTIKNKTKVDFTLCLDTGAEQTSAYSPGKLKFDNYVVDKQGVIRGIIDGTKTNRAKSAQLLEILSSLETSTPPIDDKSAVERAVLDYVEGIYDVKPELIERGVHPDLKKFGFWRPEKEDQFQPGSAMTFEQLKDLAAEYNQDGRIKADAPKKVEVLDVMDKIASAKLTAQWGTDMFHLVKQDGKWRILQVVWQSPSKK